MKMFSIRVRVIIISIVFILLIPFLSMQFTNEVNWTSLDFFVMGLLLSFAGFMFEMLMRKKSWKNCRYILIAMVFIAIILIWAELAVGIFGTVLAGS